MRRGRSLLWVCLALFAGVLWFGLTPHEVGTSWRECDTMAIARNFLVDGFDPLRPRVDWRGDTDGAVECEFPLLQLMIATTIAVFGEVEWPARLLSLLAILGAAFALHRLLEWRTSPGGALAGTLVFLTGAQAVLLGGRVQPDGLSTALVLAGGVAFLRYLGNGSRLSLWLAVAAVTFGVLQKATALQFVGLLGLWTLVLAPRRLREPRLWLGFALCLGTLAAWLWHGVCLHDETGLTFGIMSAGETKFPGQAQLLDRRVWASLVKTTIELGFTPLGCLGLLVVMLRRRLDLADLALLATVGAGLVGSMRYSSDPGAGPHYHVFSAIAGAFFVARAWPRSNPWWLWLPLLGVTLWSGAHWLGAERAKLERCTDNGTITLARRIQDEFSADDLAIVRGHREGYDPYWRRRTNYEQPTLLYQARRRGWVLPRDGFEVDKLAELRSRGARFVVNPFRKATEPDVEAWLAEHGELVFEHGNSSVYRLE
ncbi:MAG: glycosyltransferase family 39 protein [bacterium]|nr:glycosyltransferase family 39 protein [bacterium]